MNERIKQRRPSGPVIRAVSGERVTEANLLRLVVDGQEIGRVVFDPANCPVDTHEVKAWVEFGDRVEVLGA